jgi:IclR family transcriptional regulator, acetate operon repressor
MTKAIDTRQTLYPLRAVDRVCDIIDLLSEHPEGISLSTIATDVSMPKSSTFRYLAALEIRGYVTRTDDGNGYRLGPIGGATSELPSGRLERMVTIAKPLMAQLTGGDLRVALLVRLDGMGIRYLWVTPQATTDARVPRIGDRGMLHTSAAGKAVAAQLADETVMAMVAVTGMPQVTSSTLVSPTGLLRELHRIRGEGFAVSDSESHPEVRGVAVPIGGEALALGIAGRTNDLTPDRVAGAVRQLRRAAAVLARELRA